MVKRAAVPEVTRAAVQEVARTAIPEVTRAAIPEVTRVIGLTVYTKSYSAALDLWNLHLLLLRKLYTHSAALLLKLEDKYAAAMLHWHERTTALLHWKLHVLLLCYRRTYTRATALIQRNLHGYCSDTEESTRPLL